jgi:hypothetical protein
MSQRRFTGEPFMLRYCLRTLLILLAILPPLAAGSHSAWSAWHRSQRTVCRPGLKQIGIALHNYHNLTRLPGNPPPEP